MKAEGAGLVGRSSEYLDREARRDGRGCNKRGCEACEDRQAQACDRRRYRRRCACINPITHSQSILFFSFYPTELIPEIHFGVVQNV